MATESGKPGGVQFHAGYADLIAQASNNWAWIELEVHWMLWALLEVNPIAGACVTSQIYTFNAKMDALIALLKVREVPNGLVERVNKFSGSAHAAQDARNRFAHDVWLTDHHDPSLMGRTRMSARRVLDFKTVSVGLTEVNADLRRIEQCRETITQIRKDVVDALPALPKIPRDAPHPLSDVR